MSHRNRAVHFRRPAPRPPRPRATRDERDFLYPGMSASSLLLVADVAATYVDIRTLQKQLELVRDNEENQRKTYELILERFNAGDLSDVDVQQAKSSLAQTEAFVPQLEIALRQSQNALCVLLGMPPEDLAAGRMAPML